MCLPHRIGRCCSLVRAMCLLAGIAVLLVPRMGDGADSSDPESPGGETRKSFWEYDSLTGRWFGLEEEMADTGFHPRLRATQVYQHNVHGGTEAGEGGWSSTYDLDLDFELEKMLGWPNAWLHVRVQGGWRRGQGVDTEAVGSLFDINDDLGGERAADITEVRLQQNFLEDRIRLRVGKLDITKGIEVRGVPVAFDAGLYANDERNQFINSALVNNPTIAFPEKGIGVELHAVPLDWWYAGMAVTDADADARETGLNTTFDGDSDFFLIFETGVVPWIESANGRLPGAYRLGVWNDRQTKSNLDGTGTTDDDIGLYFYGEQMLWRERKSVADPEGLGVFARLGWADDRVRTIKFFYSAGAQYRGLFPGRGRDMTGIGYAGGRISNDAGTTSSTEQAVEAYHNFRIGRGLELTPHVQWISNPGGNPDADNAVVVGARLQVEF